MAEVTVRQFADIVGIPFERLLAQLGDAGLSAKNPDDKINDNEKLQLLNYLRHFHGKNIEATPTPTPKKITLKRKTKSEIRVPNAQGRAKTVSVEVRKTRTYVKRGVIESQPLTLDQEHLLEPAQREIEAEIGRQQPQEETKEQEKVAQQSGATHKIAASNSENQAIPLVNKETQATPEIKEKQVNAVQPVSTQSEHMAQTTTEQKTEIQAVEMVSQINEKSTPSTQDMGSMEKKAKSAKFKSGKATVQQENKLSPSKTVTTDNQRNDAKQKTTSSIRAKSDMGTGVTTTQIKLKKPKLTDTQTSSEAQSTSTVNIKKKQTDAYVSRKTHQGNS
ncbi:translation initiation factor IF-2 [Beggiatoa sp. PS]|nr:translation initiation factor IF-2 [Beggiatoa sp. PS]